MATTARNMTFHRIGFTSTFKAPIAFILCSIAAPVCLIVHMTRPANQPAHSPQQPALLERILRRQDIGAVVCCTDRPNGDGRLSRLAVRMMGSLRVIWERALEQHNGMDHAPPDAPGRHDPDGLPPLAPQPVEALDLVPTFHEIECLVLPALHASCVPDPKSVVYRPSAPERRTERPLAIDARPRAALICREAAPYPICRRSRVPSSPWSAIALP